MQISRQRKPKGLLGERRLVGAIVLGSPASGHWGGVAPPTMSEQAAEGDAELIYDQLVNHASECRICWVWRNQLWAVHKLCPIGAGLADRYAVAEARMGERE